MKRAAVHILLGLALAGLLLGPSAGALDGSNGASGTAMLDYDTDQLFDSQDPPHYVELPDLGQTLTLSGHSTSTITGLGSGTLYAGTNVTFGTTSTQTGTATASGAVTCQSNCTGTHTDTGTGTSTRSDTGGTRTVTFTGTTTITETSASAFSATGTASSTGTSTVSKSNTYTITGTGEGTGTASNDGTHTMTGTTTGSQTWSATSTGTGTGTGTVTFQYAKTWTGSGTFTQTYTLPSSVTVTYTIIGTGTTTSTITSTEAGTGSATWTATLTLTTTGTSAAVAANPIVGAVMTGTTTVTGAGTYTLVSPGGTKTWSSTLTVTETDIGTVTPTANKVPVADASGKLASGWLPSASGILSAWNNDILSSDTAINTDGTWTTIISRTLGTTAVVAHATANMTFACSSTPPTTVKIRINHNGSGVSAEGSRVVENGNHQQLSMSAVASFSAGSNAIHVQMKSTTAATCTVYGATISNSSGLTILQF